MEIDEDDDCTFSYVLVEKNNEAHIYAEEEKSKNRFHNFLRASLL